MCGITGYWARSGRPLSADEFAGFNDSLAHRGPDGSGVELFPEDCLWLGHRRLAIIDVSARGYQPMSYADGRYWLTYNGEIYNYLELREQLRQLGHRFTTESDSEVVLAAFAQWGEECQLRFNGMWAFAIWDAREKSLFLSRDRFGVKPLHYADVEGCFAFASELKAFLQLPWCDGTLDEDMLSETLSNINGQEGTEHTLLRGVKRLPGGCCLTVRSGKMIFRRWWETLDHLASPPSSLRKQADEFRDLFFDSCRLRLRSDVTVATALSGGLDSSAVACTIAELGRRGMVDHVPQDWQRAFVATFPGTRLDERHYAEQVVAHTGMRPHYHVVDDSVAAKHVEKIVFDLEGIYWVPLVGPWAIYREMRNDGVRVSLDGHGADELLGGYHFFVERALDALIGPQFRLRRYLDVRQTLLALRGGSVDIERAGLWSELRSVMKYRLERAGLLPHAQRLVGAARNRFGFVTRRLERLRSAKAPPQPTGPNLPPLEPLLSAYTGERRLYDERLDQRTEGMTPFNANTFSWFHASVLPTILRSYDRASMAHGIEVRMPFMDWRLVAHSFALPEESKMGHGYTKLILREAVAGLMPDSIRLRTNKIGFTTPLDEWARGGLRTWFLDLAASRSFLESDAWNGESGRAMVERSIAGHGSINAVWPAINAHVLAATFRDAARRKKEERPAAPTGAA